MTYRRYPPRAGKPRAPFTIGSNIRVNGVWFRCVDARSLNHLGSKSWGHVVWTLKANDGTLYDCYGKAGSRPSWNSTLRPALGRGDAS